MHFTLRNNRICRSPDEKIVHCFGCSLLVAHLLPRLKNLGLAKITIFNLGFWLI